MNKDNKSLGYRIGWMIGAIIAACLVVMIGALALRVCISFIDLLF